MTEIPTEALEAGIALARATKQVSLRPDRDIWVSDLEMELIRAAIRGAAPVLIAEGRRQLAARLRDHYLAAIVCDHERKLDNPQCACSLVDLGWHPSVGFAVDAWVAHVFADDPPGEYERELRAKIAAEIRESTGPGKQIPGDMRHAPWWSSLCGPYPAGFAEWAARIAEGTEHG